MSFWKRVLLSWAIIALAVFVAVLVLQPFGMITVTAQSAWLAIIVMAAVLGVLNAFIRPVLKLLSCGCIVLTLGLFVLVVNAFVFWLACQFVPGLIVTVPWGAFWGAIIVSIVSFIANVFLPVDDDTA